jgi:RimJ/RimL family protein N-acetyltransferase
LTPQQNGDAVARNPFHVPSLVTPRLRIRELLPSDLDAVHALFTEIGWNPPDLGPDAALQARSAWLGWTIAGYRQLEALYQPPLGERAVVDQASGQVVGVVGFVPSFEPFERLTWLGSRTVAGRTMELGLFWAIRPAAQGRGFATEAVGALVKHAFERLHVDRIIATTERNNMRSVAVMRRLGMTIEIYSEPHPGLQVVGFLTNTHS